MEENNQPGLVSPPIIELKKVSRTYSNGKTYVQALKEVNFTLRKGDFATVSGPSGSGKTTLLNILGLLDGPSEGSIYLFGSQLKNQSFNALATIRSSYFSFIFQSFNLNPVLTAEENVMIPLFIRKEIPKKEKQRRVDEWLDHVGLTSHKHHKPDELSGGQRQRVAIARAMVGYPTVVFADEPTANLDSVTAKQILSLMKTLNEERGTAFIFSTHDAYIREFARLKYQLVDGIFAE